MLARTSGSLAWCCRVPGAAECLAACCCWMFRGREAGSWLSGRGALRVTCSASCKTLAASQHGLASSSSSEAGKASKWCMAAGVQASGAVQRGSIQVSLHNDTQGHAAPRSAAQTCDSLHRFQLSAL